ncbi:MAG: Alkaline phosphatase synthesis sensor protein PhoR [Fibrobacterota bacterium]|jgi:two-component system phosphate regulon sensor histidine kinase PhoR
MLVGTGALLLMVGWAAAFLILKDSWGESRQADESAWLNARIDLWQDTTLRRTVVAMDERIVLVEVVDTSLRMLAHPRFPQERFSMSWKAKALVVEKDLARQRVVRFSRPLPLVRSTPSRPWFLALLALSLGSLAPLWLLWLQVRDERKRIDLLTGTARAAESGRRLPEQALEIRWGLEEEVRLAHDLGSEVRRLRILLHSEERRLQRLLDATREGVVLLDAQGRIVLCNRQAAHLLGLDEGLSRIGRDRASGQSVARSVRNHSLFTLARDLDFLERMRSGFAGTGAREFEFEAGRTEVLHLSARLSEARIDWRRSGWLLTIFDMTSRKVAERLQQRFISNVSHEFKTPLTSIRGYAETLHDELEDDDLLDPLKKKFLDRILAGTTQLEDIVADLLDLGHLAEAGRLKRASDPVELADVCRQALATVEPQARAKAVQLELTTTGPLVVRGDAHKLMRAVLNLVSNAVKYGPSIATVRVLLSQVDTEAWIEIVDQGPGIPEEKRGNLFERFYRVDEGRSREMGGTGLGLAIVKEVAEVHGGHAEVVCEPGQGSRFRIRIPLPI